MSVIGKTLGFVGKAFLILLAIGVVATLIDNDDQATSKTVATSNKSVLTESDYAARIRPYANSRYTVDQYPKTVAEFGPRLPEIERHKEAALRKALDTGRCDFAEIVELSTRSTIDNLIYWVDCENGERFWFDEGDF